MKAIVVKPGGPAPRLSWETVADPPLGPGEVLVEVKATAVNRADLLQARGLYPPPPGVTDVMGLEMSGIVRALGPDARAWVPGDRVMGLLAGGGYAESVAVDGGLLMRLPDGWSFPQGAAVPEAWLTAFLNLFLEGRLQRGQRVLVHAGASGVGTAAIQLAREAGASVFATAGSAAKLEACRGLGAVAAIDRTSQDFVAEIKAATDGRGVDLVLDPVGAPYVARNLDVLAAGGRLVTIGLMGGTRAEIDLGVLLGKSLRLIGSRLRPRPLTEKVDLVRRFTERCLPLFAAGRLRPVVDRVVPVTAAEAAHAYVKANRNIGKVILEMP
jgi:tumor protein p53-inducible protein 3